MGLKSMKRRTPALVTWLIGVTYGAFAVGSWVLLGPGN